MKNNIKIKGIILALLSFIIIGSLDYSYGINETSNPVMISRGLVFNTGRSSDQIRLLKDFFRVRGEKNVPWGYDYDNRTKELVRKYQREIGLSQDGIVGRKTMESMNSEIRDRNYKLGLRVPYTDISGEMILINKSSNTLYLMRNGIIQESYPVATGKTSQLTPDGKHSVTTKGKDPSWGGAGISDPIAGGAPNNPLGTRWIGISYGGGWKYGVHGNSNASSIGSYASLGCVRMFNSDVERLYEKVKKGTPVWIGDEYTLMKYGVKFKSNFKEGKKPKEEIKYSKAVIKLNGKLIKLQSPIINNDGRTYYPFRELLEVVGAKASWDGENRIAIGELNSNNVKFYPDSNRYKVNGLDKYLEKDQKVFIHKGKTYIPIRNLMEAFNYKVGWEESSRTILINGEVK